MIEEKPYKLSTGGAGASAVISASRPLSLFFLCLASCIVYSSALHPDLWILLSIVVEVEVEVV